jgi:hypothetical protein
MNVRQRKAIGCFILLAYIAIYAIFAATLGSALAPRVPAWAELVYYAVAGIVWIFPLKPLFAWINRTA